MRIQSIVAASAVLMSSTLLVQAQQAASGSHLYPVDKRVQVLEEINRPCTQLENGAGIAPQDCGRMPLEEVAAAFFEASED